MRTVAVVGRGLTGGRTVAAGGGVTLFVIGAGVTTGLLMPGTGVVGVVGRAGGVMRVVGLVCAADGAGAAVATDFGVTVAAGAAGAEGCSVDLAACFGSSLFMLVEGDAVPVARGRVWI